MLFLCSAARSGKKRQVTIGPFSFASQMAHEKTVPAGVNY